ncbi:unnamed protein product [Strongylus vulgaris]|uniref:Uncharacterized protein n=1 Tax=Strongylus vulgaris TaxID=40348 RepID=A0A3P7L3A5_STRVU|nr:unnamed protein product [Strongylus vulgaris]
MLIPVSILLLLITYATKQDSLEDDPKIFEDLTNESITRLGLFEPLPPLPQMTSVRRVIPGPPGIRPPPGFKEQEFGEEMVVVSANGSTRIMGVSRRKPRPDESVGDEED